MKRIVSLLTAVVLLFSLTACSGGNSSSESSASGGSSASDSSSADNSGSSDASLPEGEDITLSFLRLGNDEAERVFWEEVIASYESEHPGVKIEYDDAPIGDDMDLKLTSLFTANAGPDIIGHGILSVASRVEAGYYLPITQYYENWEGKDDMFPQLVDLGTYNGEVYGLAYQPAPYVFAYRIDLLEQAGFDGPPTTWAELKEYSEKLAVIEDGRVVQAGFAFPASAGNLVEYDVFAYGNGGGFVDENGNPTLDTPENLEALQFVSELLPYSMAYNTNENNPFMSGNAAMALIDNVLLTPLFTTEGYEGKIGIALPPSNEGKDPMTFSGCRLLFIGKDCKNQDAAFDFIQYAVSQQVVQKRSEDLNVPVVLNSLVDDFAALDPYNQVRADCVAHGIGMPIVTWSTMFQRVRNEMIQRIWNGDDPATVLSEAQTKLEDEIQSAS